MRETLSDAILTFWTEYLGSDVTAAIIFGLILIYIIIILLVAIHPPFTREIQGRKRRLGKAPSNPSCRRK